MHNDSIAGCKGDLTFQIVEVVADEMFQVAVLVTARAILPVVSVAVSGPATIGGLVGIEIARIDLVHIIARLERRLATLASAVGLVFDECLLQRLPRCGTPRCRTFGKSVLLNVDFEAPVAVVLRLIEVPLRLKALCIAIHEDR